MNRKTRRRILEANPYIFAAGMAMIIIGSSVDQLWLGLIGAVVVSWPICFMLWTYPRDK